MEIATTVVRLHFIVAQTQASGSYKHKHQCHIIVDVLLVCLCKQCHHVTKVFGRKVIDEDAILFIDAIWPLSGHCLHQTAITLATSTYLHHSH